MAQTFPLSLAMFFDDIGISESSFTPDPAVAGERTAGAESLTMEVGHPFWSGTIDVRAETHKDADRKAARAHWMIGGGGSFLVTHAHRIAPAADPGGSLFAGRTPTLTSVSAPSGNREVTMAGLPPGFALTRGDCFSFLYGVSPTRYAFHEIMEDRTTGAGGGVVAIEVWPPIEPGFTPGCALTFVRPHCKAKFEPGTFKPVTQRSRISYGFSFAWKQTFR